MRTQSGAKNIPCFRPREALASCVRDCSLLARLRARFLLALDRLAISNAIPGSGNRSSLRAARVSRQLSSFLTRRRSAKSRLPARRRRYSSSVHSRRTSSMAQGARACQTKGSTVFANHVAVPVLTPVYVRVNLTYLRTLDRAICR